MAHKTLLYLALLTAPISCAQDLYAQDVTPDALFQAGVNNLSSKNFTEADAAFRRLRAMEPGNVRGVVGVGQTFMAQGKFDAAIQYVTAEIAKDPGNPKLNLVLGDLAVQAGHMEIAAVRFQRALDLLAADPNAAGFFVKRSSKRPPESLKKPFDAALDNFIGNDATPAGAGGVYIRLAESFLQMGDGARGVEALENARKFLPNEGSILLNLAILYEIARNGPRALAAYRDLLKIRPDEVVALNNVAFFLAETNGDLDEALRYALHARDLEPQSVEVADTLGWVYFKRKAYTEAISVFVRLVQGTPDKTTYRDHLRLALEAAGDKSESVAQLRKTLSEPPSEEGNRALSELLTKMYP